MNKDLKDSEIPPKCQKNVYSEYSYSWDSFYSRQSFYNVAMNSNVWITQKDQVGAP